MFLRQNAPESQQPYGPGAGDAPRLQRPGVHPPSAPPRSVEQARPEAEVAPGAAQAVVVAPMGGTGAAEAQAAAGKRLIVGDGISLKGEITACDLLVVEGHVEVTLNETRMLEIRPSGRFIGSCEVEEAEVSGVYEGDLTVRGRLTVRASGRLAGRIHYGEIELERGGRIAGELSVREPDGAEAGAVAEHHFHGGNAA